MAALGRSGLAPIFQRAQTTWIGRAARAGARYGENLRLVHRRALQAHVGLWLGSGLTQPLALTAMSGLLVLACGLMLWTCYNRLRMALLQPQNHE